MKTSGRSLLTDSLSPKKRSLNSFLQFCHSSQVRRAESVGYRQARSNRVSSAVGRITDRALKSDGLKNDLLFMELNKRLVGPEGGKVAFLLDSVIFRKIA